MDEDFSPYYDLHVNTDFPSRQDQDQVGPWGSSQSIFPEGIPRVSRKNVNKQPSSRIEVKPSAQTIRHRTIVNTMNASDSDHKAKSNKVHKALLVCSKMDQVPFQKKFYPSIIKKNTIQPTLIQQYQLITKPPLREKHCSVHNSQEAWKNSAMSKINMIRDRNFKESFEKRERFTERDKSIFMNRQISRQKSREIVKRLERYTQKMKKNRIHHQQIVEKLSINGSECKLSVTKILKNGLFQGLVSDNCTPKIRNYNSSSTQFFPYKQNMPRTIEKIVKNKKRMQSSKMHSVK